MSVKMVPTSVTPKHSAQTQRGAMSVPATLDTMEMGTDAESVRTNGDVVNSYWITIIAFTAAFNYYTTWITS